MLVVDERDEMERINQAVGGVACNDVDFFIHERAVDEAQVHHTGLRGEMQAVELAPAFEAVRALKEFVSETGTHLGGERDDVASVTELEPLGVLAADDHRESVLEAERLGD